MYRRKTLALAKTSTTMDNRIRTSIFHGLQKGLLSHQGTMLPMWFFIDAFNQEIFSVALITFSVIKDDGFC